MPALLFLRPALRVALDLDALARSKGQVHPDPIASPRTSQIRRFGRIMKWTASLSIAIAALAVVLAAAGQGQAPVRGLIASALGAGLAVLIGAGVMSVALLGGSSPSGEAAAKRQEIDPE